MDFRYDLNNDVYGLRNKAWTLTCKKEQNELKGGRKESLVIAKSVWRVAEWPFDRLKFQCASLKEKIKLARERSCRRVAKWFRDAVLDRPKLHNLKMLKAKAKR
uniref:Uncharacterized protein n=1 Tax=Solanum tuberosum TaxID=4113 RepID=M1DU71_SOLTU